MSKLIDNIDAQIAANEAGQRWGQNFLQKDNLNHLKGDLVRNRLELKHIRYALGMNPAAAVFGQSQVGKSYLMDNLLASKKGPLYLYDGHGKAYNFIEEINPLGNGKESTSLISRFTTHKLWNNDDYPIKASLLSPSDIVLMLCDTYYNDIKSQNGVTKEQLREFLQNLTERYKGKPSVQHFITDVEMYEMRQYILEQDVLSRGETFRNHLNEERYFEKVACVIEAISPDQWIDVFSILWNNEPSLTEVYCKLMNSYRMLDFVQDVYIQMDAVLRNTGTLLHVDRLFELFGVSNYMQEDGKTIDVEIAKVQDMKVWNGKKEVTLQKSEMCALTAEVVLTAGEELENEKPFLKQLDVLDFPGARSRKIEELPLSQATACQLLIRGKVAYLFNKYSRQYLISNLLFCHHRDQSDVSTLSGLLKGWVGTMVGKTVEERTARMKLAKVSPLFLIGTKFNLDMERDDKDVSENQTTREDNKEKRWNTRFANLSNLIGSDADWFSNWQMDGSKEVPFKNTYLLRSYNFSCIKKVYKGYKRENTDGTLSLNVDAEGNVIGETGLEENFRTFIPEIRETFLANSFVMSHFEDPELAWFEVTGVGADQIVREPALDANGNPRKDENGNTVYAVKAKDITEPAESKYHGKGVSPFHDGSDYIIRNLTISSNNVREMRDSSFDAKIKETMVRLCQALGGNFHDDNSDSALRETLSDAGEITILLDALFGSDKYFFSEFIDKILIRENELVDNILDTIKSNVMIEGTDMSVLFAIRENAKVNPELTIEENRKRLREAYHKTTDVELDEELVRIGKTILKPKRDDSNPLTVDEIINPPMVRNFARIIVDEVERFWLEQYLQLDNFDEFVERGMNREYIDKLIKKMNVLYRNKLHVSDKMTERIHNYVVNPSNFDTVAEMIADICAEMINKFVNTMGVAYFHEGNWKSLGETIKHNNFDINIEKYEFDDVTFDAEQTKKDLNVVFDVFDNVDSILNEVPVDFEKLSYFSNYHAYREWTDMLKMAFLVTCDIPTYDPVANNALREVLLKHIINSAELRGMLSSAEYEQYHMKGLITES